MPAADDLRRRAARRWVAPRQMGIAELVFLAVIGVVSLVLIVTA